MILMDVQDIVKEVPTDVLRPDVTAIPCEFTDNYEMRSRWHCGLPAD